MLLCPSQNPISVFSVYHSDGSLLLVIKMWSHYRSRAAVAVAESGIPIPPSPLTGIVHWLMNLASLSEHRGK